jgi:hypothetical protein
MGQRVLPLAGEVAADIEAKRKWVLGHYERDPEASYATVEAKLLLLDTILSNNWVEPTETVKLRALGVAFGDALAQQLGLTWVAIDDEYGCDAALIAAACSTIRRIANDA